MPQVKYVMRQLIPCNLICMASFHDKRETSDINEAYKCLEYWTNLKGLKYQIEEEQDENSI